MTLALAWEVFEAIISVVVLVILLNDWIADRQARKAKP